MGWAIVRGFICQECAVRNFFLKVQCVPKCAQLLIGHLLDLMSCIAAFNVVTECPALHGFAQNCGWTTRAEIFSCRFKRCIQLAIVVTTARQGAQLLIGKMRHHFAQAWVWTKEVFANVVAIFNDVALEFAVDSCIHLVQQHTVMVVGEELVPLGTPHHFDDVPPSATERSFKFLNDFAVTAHRAIKSLQVAVHNKREVV